MAKRNKLHKYCDLFGFDFDDFLFSRFLNQITSYVEPKLVAGKRTTKGIAMSASAQECLSSLEGSVRQLNNLHSYKPTR